LGTVLRLLGERLEGEGAEQLLRQAVDLHKQVLTVYRRDTFPQRWAETQSKLGATYQLLNDWQRAAESFVNVLSVYPNNEEVNRIAAYLNHEVLYNYGEAFRLNQRWVENNKGSSTVEAYFAENHFTTGRFSECEERIAKLLARPDLGVRIKVALQLIEMANLIALSKANLVPARMDLLIAAISKQPADFKGTWQFAGTKHFIGQHEKLASHRAWLDQLFEAIKGSNREAILKSLQEVRAKFKP
jgi:tetratricopeptide (TPR) repeat protein